MTLVLVESPTKVKSLSNYLGKGYTVMATYGHVRDLPSKANSVDPEQNFAMTFQPIDKNVKHLHNIQKACKKAARLLLATDPDREGEAISWHVSDYLKEQGIAIPTERITFNAITKKAVLEAIKAPRTLDTSLVDAYLARLGLDYLVGFTLSPLLWRKLPGCRSAGRVQSVALRILCDREHEIETFKTQEYWSIDGTFKQDKHTLTAHLRELDGQKLEKFTLRNEKDANAAVKKADASPYTLSKVEKKEVKRNPAAPFMTSTLQQEASRKLGWGATQTMRAAQKLYEGAGMSEGVITYMRTDSTSMADEAISAARKQIHTQYGKDFVSPDVRVYKRKARNAQEAHEAIRPTNFAHTPKDLASQLPKDLLALYELIWCRAIASQMASARFDQVIYTLTHPKGTATFRATGRTCTFRGFLEVYLEGKDLEDEKEDDLKTLPTLAQGSQLDLTTLTPNQHFTEPPPRFSEASLIKRMEELGIGRPSTYARIMQVLKERDYVSLEKKQLLPQEKGRVVSSFLVKFFKEYVENTFTANLEESLDAVSRGEQAWRAVLQDFWDPFKGIVDSTMDIKTVDVIQAVEKDLKDHLFQGEQPLCPACKKGHLHLRLGKFGPFLGCNTYPDCNYMRSLSSKNDKDEPSDQENTLSLPRVLGTDPEKGLEITLRRGPYGFYFQWGEDKKPKRVSLPKTLAPESVTLKDALRLGQLPINLGPHPETGDEMIGNLGRFGPYVLYQKRFFSVKEIDVLLDKRIETILDLIKLKQKSGFKAPSRGKK